MKTYKMFTETYVDSISYSSRTSSGPGMSRYVPVADLNASTKEYGKSLEKIAKDRAIKALSRKDRETLMKIAKMLDKEKKEEVENLKNEAKVRIERYLNNLNLQNEPKIFAQLNDKDKYLFYVDAGSSRLYLYENIDGKLSYKDDFYVSIGKNGFGKQYEGDKKTPVGVYFTGKKIRESLSDFYGEAAYPLSYPNEIDIKNKRNGSGIWLHGTPKTTYNRAPLASDGCIVLSNPDLMKLSSVLDNNKIPIIISFQSLKDLESSNKNLAERKLSLINAIERWREKWEDQDTESYLKFYSKNFYYLITASLFDSKFQNKNKIWRNTIYNNSYAGNALIGKEFKLKKNNSISINIRYLLRGGNCYTPINLKESIARSTTILDNTKLFSAQYPDYWRTDFSFSYKKNKNKSTWSYGADIQNVTDRKNIVYTNYDNTNKRINNNYALPRIPIIFMRCEF